MVKERAPPPPAPPPPSSFVFKSSKILENSKRPSENREHVVRISTTEPMQRRPFANVHPETLQHAAAGLRKTQYREPLLSYEIESPSRRTDQLFNQQYWKNISQYEPLDQSLPRTTIYASSPNFTKSYPSGIKYQSTNLLNSNNLNSNNFNLSNNTTLSTNSKFSNNNNNNNFYSHQSPINAKTSTENNLSAFYNNEYQNNNNNRPLNCNNVTNNNLNNKLEQKILSTSSSYPKCEISTNSSTNFVEKDDYKIISTKKNDSFPLYKNKLSPTISDPKVYINNYATKTPALSVYDNQQKSYLTTSTIFGNSNNSINNSKKEEKQDLTGREKFLNNLKKSVAINQFTPLKSNNNMNEQNRSINNPEFYKSVDMLINDMSSKMHTSLKDICTKCKKKIEGDVPGVTALGNAYHVTCFTCDDCQKQLAGCSFYSVDGRNLCQVDYMNSLEKCDKCATPITQKILRAMNKAFHPECFVCPACNKSLDGIPFTVDKNNEAYCLECYHERFSPRCAACLKAIAPVGNETEVARVIAMDRSYHIDCYKCEDCGLKLNSKIEGQGCYPLESHLLCKECNLKRLKNTYQPTSAN